MKMKNPLKRLTKFERALWLVSVLTVIVSFVMSGGKSFLSMAVSLVGVTALIFVARGEVLGQVLTVVFSLMYALISYRLSYYGEMITYLGMTAPIAAVSVVTWLRHQFENKSEVRVNKLSLSHKLLLGALTVATTVLFYFILKYFNTANLFVSTISIATSFCASYLMMMRCSTYAVAYAANDVVLIVLWIMAALDDISFLPMVLCFVIFLVNDIYGFYNWKRMWHRQNA